MDGSDLVKQGDKYNQLVHLAVDIECKLKEIIITKISTNTLPGSCSALRIGSQFKWNICVFKKQVRKTMNIPYIIRTT